MVIKSSHLLENPQLNWWICLGYLKKVVEKLKEGGADDAKVKEFQKKVQNYYTSKIAPNFGDYDFYTGESMDPDGMYADILLSCWNGDTLTMIVKGFAVELPRGWHDALCHNLERRLVRDEGIKGEANRGGTDY